MNRRLSVLVLVIALSVVALGTAPPEADAGPRVCSLECLHLYNPSLVACGGDPACEDIVLSQIEACYCWMCNICL